MRIETLVDRVKTHRCYSHPIFHNWARVNPGTEAIGALFHHIRSFCDATRPGWNLPEGLKQIGLPTESHLLQEIVDSEENHGPELAMMAGHIINRSVPGKALFDDLSDQAHIESMLKRCSDELLGQLPGYDFATGLMPQTKKAIHTFEARKSTAPQDVYKSLGTALALEIISNRQLIPGEKACLIDSGLYRTSFDEPAMHYLLEHYGETGAECQHEQNAIEAVGSVLSAENSTAIVQGADDFLNNLEALWDLLDATLLQAEGSRAAA
ncbi:hypothetical protein HBO04_02765 [Pseudomonas proteolytica]|uniref:hypothetical protein n=1 Tax=Pseudomonas proteolytica TaxID=219574 RepID=UPI001473258F|nr:hypothetical protein [Pseudomonas proteolytica]NMY99021.1 hypothetical protein [Pseudomonas proteolytica]